MIRRSCLLTLLLVSCVGSIDSYQLNYWRGGNELILYCQTPESIDYDVVFRINETNPIYISTAKSHTSDANLTGVSVLSKPHLRGIKFNLYPDNEGTFFCGNPLKNIWSEGLGPLVADPSEIKDNRNYLYQKVRTTNGSNVTLICPIQLGKLAQFYTVNWFGISNESGRFQINVENYAKRNVKMKFSTLTVTNIQDSDYKTYTCKVTIINPQHDKIWEFNANITLLKQHHWNWNSLGIVHSGLINKKIFLIFVSLTLIFAGIFCTIGGIKSLRRRQQCYVMKLEAGEEEQALSGATETSEYCMDEEVETYEDCIADLELVKDNCIGIGAFGTVFRGTYKGLVCAAKMLTHHAQFYASGMKAQPTVQELALKSLQKECEFLKKISHSNVVDYIATVIEPHSNLPILVMELMDCSLKSYLEGRQSELLPTTFQISLFLDISRGLEFLHSKSLIHRDICDDNVLLRVKDNIPRAKISDFGMSRLIPQDHMSSTLSALGHRQIYLPPEAAEYPVNYTDTLDVYALGVLGLQIALMEIRVKDCNDLLAKLSENHSLRKIIVACLRENGLDRPSSTEVVNMITVV